jgi:uncharacterized protein with PQ loop repeat
MSLAKELSEWTLGAGLFVNGCFFIPQIWRLYQTKDSSSVSLLTFFGFAITQIIAIINGYYYDNWAMVWGYAFSVVTCSGVIFLIIYYQVIKNKKN